jgi:Effector Associated Constant Component 1
MAKYYTIESADDSVPLDRRSLRELRDLVRADEDLDVGVRLIDRPPAPGEQGAITVALEIIVAATPLGKAFARVLEHWIDSHKLPPIRVSRKNYGFEIGSGTVQDAERLIEKLERESGAEPDDAH